MKIYKIAIVGILIIGLGVLFSISTPSPTLADQIKEVIVANFPALQEVLIVNTDPIDVNVMNSSSSSEPEVVFFFEDKCEAEIGDVSPTIEADGYDKIILFPLVANTPWRWSLDISFDGINWTTQANRLIYTPDVQIFDVIAPYYRIMIAEVGTVCLTIQGYLKP